MNVLRAVIQIISVRIFGLSFSWFGLAVALPGLIKDFIHDRYIKGILMHNASVVLNLYFSKLLYFG